MKVFITGGCKNGKSFFARRLTKTQITVSNNYFYVATMRSTGAEDDETIARHRREREGKGFITVEQPERIEEILTSCGREGSFLIDSVTALLVNEMFPGDGLVSRGGQKPRAEVNLGAAKTVADGLVTVIKGLDNIVVVSDYIFCDAGRYDRLTEAYRRALAEVDRAVAAHCDAVLEIAYSNVIVHKWTGTLPPLLFEEVRL